MSELIRQVFVCDECPGNRKSPVTFSRVIREGSITPDNIHAYCPYCWRPRANPSHEYRTLSPDEAKDILAEAAKVSGMSTERQLLDRIHKIAVGPYPIPKNTDQVGEALILVCSVIDRIIELSKRDV